MSAVKMIDRLATTKAMLIIVALYAVVFGAILFTLSQLTVVSGGYGILDFDFGYDMARVDNVLGSYGSKGMALYGRIQILDLFNPALYSLIAAIFTRLVWRGQGPDWLCLVPLLGGFGDYAENITLFLMAHAYPDVSSKMVAVSSTLSFVKNGLIAVGVLVLLAGFALRMAQYLRRA
ncbi:MAG: hypothetical protein ACPGVK_01020 [Halocynthiibacter sp.]